MMPESMWDEAFRRITTRLADDQRFMLAVRLDLAIAHQPWDHLSQHPGELCDCGHPAHDHEQDDGTVGACLECGCHAFSDGMIGWAW